MKATQKPVWILVSLSAPQLILLLILGRLYGEARGLLTPVNHADWLGFGLSAGLLWLGFTGFSLACLIRRRPLPPLTGLALLGLYLPWLYLALANMGKIIPANIPRWALITANPEILPYLFTIPALLYALIFLVSVSTPEPGRYKPWRDLILTVAFPAAWYLLFNAALLWLHFGPSPKKIAAQFLPIFSVLLAVGFLFFLMRLVYALVREKKAWLEGTIIVVVLTLPVAGLALNQILDGAFGDFSHPLFYILAALTGFLVALPAPDPAGWRLAFFGARAVTFPFTAYFFAVFLPFLPLALPLMIFLGAGLLLLAPAILGVRHARVLWQDFVDLRRIYRPLLLVGLFALGCLVLPSAWCLTVRNDGVQIQRALNYLYRSSYSPDKQIKISEAGLARALKSMTINQSRRWGLTLDGGRTPYLTPLYNRIALDNLTLSQDRIQALNRIFLGHDEKSSVERRSGNASSRAPSVNVISIKTSTTADQAAGCYRGRLEFELRNETWQGDEEFSTSFDLPAGCYIQGYYLVVGGKRKQGMLADQRAASWVYDQALQTRRDPGILAYGPGNRVTLRVYPFAAQETHYTGLVLIHAAPVSVTIAGRTLHLGKPGAVPIRTRFATGAVYFPAEAKSGLPRVARSAQYHFVVDYSAAARGKTAEYLARVESFLRSRKLNPSLATVTAANYGLRTVAPTGVWRTSLSRVRPTGGFALDQAIKAFLFQHYQEAAPSYPVIVVVTDLPAHWAIHDDYASWRPAFPDASVYYRLDAAGELYALSLWPAGKDPSGQIVSVPLRHQVLAWPSAGRPRAYLADDASDGLILAGEAFTTGSAAEEGSAWETGLRLEASNLALIFDPSDYRRRELTNIQTSLASGVMTGSTSYLVLENELQEAALRRKQRQILATRKVADLEDAGAASPEGPAMIEPSLLILILLVAVIFLGKRLMAGRKARRLAG